MAEGRVVPSPGSNAHRTEGRSMPLEHWRLIDSEPGAGMPLQLATAALDRPGMAGISAPGDIHLSLVEHGRIAHPFRGDATESQAWVEDKEWWYRIDFESPSVSADQRVILEFDGLDTFASVWLNGMLVGRADNMFRQWRFDITSDLRRGINKLAVCFTPPALSIEVKELPPFAMASSPSAENHRNFVRKAQFGWGWDFAPRIVTAGIWKAATLRIETRAVLGDVRFTTDGIEPGLATARVSIDVSADEFACHDAIVAFTVTLRAPDGRVVSESELSAVERKAHLSLELHDPQLWWTSELGAPNLYALSVALRVNGTEVDRRELKVGIRTITLDTSPDLDEPGTKFFRFVLNGVPIFSRGVNWVPPSSFVATIDEPLYRRLLTLAAAAHMNMIRVWGGGIYEYDAFYDLCDELGLLVWQDFMFACPPYPEHDPAFVDNVRSEVAHQVRRLRHHACLALWCGNNECQGIHGYSNSKNSRDDVLLGVLFYDQVIPEQLAKLDPGTPYWPGSPFAGPKNNHNSMREGDIHDWTVWHGLQTIPDDVPVGDHDRSPAGVAFTRYAEDTGRFISEFGIQAAPVLTTFERALADDQLVLGSPGFLSRIKDKPNDKVDAMLVSVTGLPATLREYIDFTQINQAEGLKFGIEHFRRRKPHCSGTLLWQFNDCWPGISWSIVDFSGFAKAGYHYVKRAYSPVLASFKAAAGVVELWITNDTLVPVDEQLCVALGSFDGIEHQSETVRCQVGPNASACVWTLDEAERYGARHVLTVRASSGLMPTNRHFFAPIKDLVRPVPSAPIVVIEGVSRRETRVTVTAREYLYFVHVLTEDENTIASDNYVDLSPGEVREIVLHHHVKPLDPATIEVRWR